MIEAEVVNLGWLNAGIVNGERLRFPTDPETAQAALRRIGADDGKHDVILGEYRSDIPGLVACLSPYDRMEELNYLAGLVSIMTDYDRAKFAAAVEHGEYTGEVVDLINLTYNLDCYNFHTGIHTAEDLGRLRAEGRVKLPEDCRFYFDYEAYGRDTAINEGGEFTHAGYIYNNHSAFTRHYDGKSIPNIYRLYTYPGPEKTPIRETLAACQRMVDAAPGRDRPAPTEPER